jgi:hypothetical protein
MWLGTSRRTQRQRLAVALVENLVGSSAWTHRRIESVALLEGERARWRVSSDVTVPELYWPLGTRKPPHTLVPLAMVAKSDMRQFDATDESGGTVPVLGSTDNQELSTLFLTTLFSAETGITPDRVDSQLIAEIVEGLAPLSADAARRLSSRHSLQSTLTSRFAFWLAEHFVLFAVLPASAVGTRRVVKFSFHWRTPPVHGFRRLVDLFKRMAAAAGWRPYELWVELGVGPLAASKHLEVPAPAGIQCVDLTLYDHTGQVVSVDRTHGSVGHAHVGLEATASRATVRFDPDLSGLHQMVTWSAWATAALLLATYWRLASLSKDPGTPVSLLLFGPALLLTFLVRPGENWLASAVTGPLRALAFVLAGSLFAAGFGLSAGFHPAPHATHWGTFADVGWRCAIVLSAASGIILAIGRVVVRRRHAKGVARHG